MHSLYNRVAGQNSARWAALSDALVALWPRLLIFLMSGMTNGIFRVGQQTQLNQFARADRNLAWTHIALLCAIPLTPHGSAGGSRAEKSDASPYLRPSISMSARITWARSFDELPYPPIGRLLDVSLWLEPRTRRQGTSSGNAAARSATL